MLENFSISQIGYPEYVKVLIIILVGFLVGFLVKLTILKLSEKTLYIFVRKYHPKTYKSLVSLVQLVSNIVQWIIIFLFLFEALSVFQIYLLNEIVRLSVLFLPKLAIASIILIIGGLVASIISQKIKESDLIGKEIISTTFVFVFMFAVILSALEVIDIKLTPIQDLFRALVYSFGFAVALAIGISFGLALKPEIEKLIKKISKKKKEKN
jgi:hypothetical protein